MHTKSTELNLMSLFSLLLLCQIVEAQDYIIAQVPGASISIQYPEELAIDTGESSLSWNANDAPSLSVDFGRVDEAEFRETIAQLDELGELGTAEGFGYLVAPSKLSINSFETTELKFVVPSYALLEDGGEEVVKTLVHMYVLEINDAFYMCSMYDTVTEHQERYDSIFIRMCNSVEAQ